MRIAQLVGDCPWGNMLPELLTKGVGGRETAALRLSEHWAAMGHTVDNYVPVDRAYVYDHESGGSQRFAPFDLGLLNLQAFPYDAVVSVEMPYIYADEYILERQADAVRVTHMQVAHVDDRIDMGKLVDDETIWSGLSEWHNDFLRMQGCTGDFVVNPNGVNMDLYRYAIAGRMGPPKYFYSSSPDRGLMHLLDVWPMVRKELPDAELTIAYGVEHIVNAHKWSHNREGEMALRIKKVLELDGVNYVGKIGQLELANIQMQAHALLYPCDPMSPTETGCITVVEALAAGAVACITEADCLGSEFGNVGMVTTLPFSPSEFADNAISCFQPEIREQYVQTGLEFAQTRDWKGIAEGWISFFEDRLR